LALSPISVFAEVFMQTQAEQRRLQFLYIANTAGEITVNTAENL
jgi:hypothetical protein